MPLQQDEEAHDGAFGAIDDWRSPEAVADRDRRQAQARDKRREMRFGRISPNFDIERRGTLLSRQPKSIDWAIDDWQAQREVSFLAGESEAGKTFLAIDIALRTCLGWPVFGRRTKAGLVIYQIGESPNSLLDLRWPAWRQEFGQDLPSILPFEILASKINLWTADPAAKDGARELLSAIQGIRADYSDMPLVAIYGDTWSKAFIGGNENDGRDVARAIGNAEMLAHETGAHVCLIHHFPKGGATLRGHSSFKADVHAVAMVSTDKEKVRTIRFDKLKDGEKAEIKFELKQVRLGERDDGKPITSCVVLPVGEKAAQRHTDVSNSVRLSTDELGFFQAFWKALHDYGGTAHPSLDCPPSIRVAPCDEIKRNYTNASPIMESELGDTEEAREDAGRRHGDRLRKQMERAAKKLNRNLGVIRFGKAPDPDTGKSVDYAWWTGRPVRDMPQTYPPKPKQTSDAVSDVVAAEGGDWTKDIF